MKKLLLISALLLSVSLYGQEKNNHKLIYAIGGVSGFTTNSQNPSMIFGGWVDFGKIGIEFKRGMTLGDEDFTNLTNTNTHTISSTFRNLGVFVPLFNISRHRDATVFVSMGGQFADDITTKGNKKSHNPYAGFGIDFSFGPDNRAIIRTEYQISKISTVGMGVGYKF
jgi:hypothetical protein